MPRRTKPTPGPWTVFSQNGVLAIMDKDGREIIHWTGFDGSTFDDAKNKANAALIAAAPVMLAALINSEFQLTTWAHAAGEGVDCLKEIRAALKVARRSVG